MSGDEPQDPDPLRGMEMEPAKPVDYHAIRSFSFDDLLMHKTPDKLSIAAAAGASVLGGGGNPFIAPSQISPGAPPRAQRQKVRVCSVIPSVPVLLPSTRLGGGASGAPGRASAPYRETLRERGRVSHIPVGCGGIGGGAGDGSVIAVAPFVRRTRGRARAREVRGAVSPPFGRGAARVGAGRWFTSRRVGAREQSLGWLFWGAWFLGGRASLSLSRRSLRAAAFVVAARSLPIPLVAHTPPLSSARSGVI